MNIFVLMFLMFNFSSSALKDKEVFKRSDTLVIHFQDFFINDTTSLSINGQTIFSNKILNSARIIGYTGVEIKVYKEKEENILIIEYETKLTKAKIKGDKLNLTVSLNNNITNYSISGSVGGYLGISKIGDNKLNIIHSLFRFLYE